MRIYVSLLAMALLLMTLPVKAQTQGVPQMPGPSQAPSAQTPNNTPAATTPAVPSAASQQATSAPMPYSRRPYRETLEQRFSAANTTHDGKLSLDQAKAGLPYAARHFTDIDKDHQGYVTVEEIRAFAAARRQAYRQNP